MSTDTLDMSILAKDLIFGDPGKLATTALLLHADGSRPITLDFKASSVNPPLPKRTSMGPFDNGSNPQYKAQRTLIMQARRGGEELWAIRMLPSGRLLIQPGTEPSRESAYGYPGELALGVSFNPITRSLSVVVRDGGSGPTESFNLTANTCWWADGDYEILLGAPESYADQSPIGWRIDCSFRYGLPVAPQIASLPVEDQPLTKALAELATAFDADPFAPRRFLQGPGTSDAERHWQAMLALASGRERTSGEELARDAAMIDAHNAWKEGR